MFSRKLGLIGQEGNFHYFSLLRVKNPHTTPPTTVKIMKCGFRKAQHVARWRKPELRTELCMGNPLEYVSIFM